MGEGNGNSLQCSCLENPRDGGAWWAAVYGVAQSRTRLKRLSSSSSSSIRLLIGSFFSVNKGDNYKFSSKHCLVAYHTLWYVVSSFLFISKHCLVFLLTPSLTHLLSRSALFSCHVFVSLGEPFYTGSLALQRVGERICPLYSQKRGPWSPSTTNIQDCPLTADPRKQNSPKYQ